VRRFLTVLFLVLLTSWGTAHEIKVGTLIIVHPMVDEAEDGQATVSGSKEIRNEGTNPRRLLLISSDFAGKAKIEGPLPLLVKRPCPILIQFEKNNTKLSEYEVYNSELVFSRHLAEARQVISEQEQLGY
jgi:hypothetical protein